MLPQKQNKDDSAVLKKENKVTVAVQCEECTCNDENPLSITNPLLVNTDNLGSPDETLSPVSSTSSCSTCSSTAAEQQKRHLGLLKQRSVAMRRETIHEEDENDSDLNESEKRSEIIAV